MMTSLARSQSGGRTNNKWYKDLPEMIETLKDEPNDEDFTEPNLSQWDKEQVVPLLDGNSCVVIVSKVVGKEKIVLNKAKYNVRMGKWSNDYNMNGKLGDDNWIIVKSGKLGKKIYKRWEAICRVEN